MKKEGPDMKIRFGDTGENEKTLLYETGPISESMLSKEKKEVNLDEWKNSNSGILYVTGLSGGGKSTLTKELSKRFNVPYFELDFFIPLLSKGENFEEWIKERSRFSENMPGEFMSLLRSFISKSDKSLPKNHSKQDIYAKALDLAIAFCKVSEKNLKKKYIFEGTYIFRDKAKDFFTSDKSYIIIGTGLIKSNFRAIKRSFSKNRDLPLSKRIKSLKYRINDIFDSESSVHKQSIEFDGFRDRIISESNRRFIMRPAFPGSRSEFATDLNAMYGSSMKLGKEDKEAYSQAKKYVLSESKIRRSK
jgi:adenylate kinase family enzyme